MDESHDANDDTNEASQQGQNHEGAGGVPVCFGVERGQNVLRLNGVPVLNKDSMHTTHVGPLIDSPAFLQLKVAILW